MTGAGDSTAEIGAATGAAVTAAGGSTENQNDSRSTEVTESMFRDGSREVHLMLQRRLHHAVGAVNKNTMPSSYCFETDFRCVWCATAVTDAGGSTEDQGDPIWNPKNIVAIAYIGGFSIGSPLKGWRRLRRQLHHASRALVRQRSL